MQRHGVYYFTNSPTTRYVALLTQIDGHPPAFKILNSQLNQEVLAWEQAQARGTHVLSSEPTYDPGDNHSRNEEEEREERRIRVLRATEARLARLDGDVDARCGTRRSSP